jgi:hypothetical protein
MFYTIVSRTIITKVETSRDYLYIFIVGSIGYIALHWYLHIEVKNGIMEKLREYLYYIMVVDMMTAYAMNIFYPVKSGKPIDTQLSDDKTDNGKHVQYTPEEQKMIMARMQEARRLQLQKENAEQNNNKEVDKNKVSVMPSKEENRGDCDSGKKSIFTKSDDSSNDDEEETNGENKSKEPIKKEKSIEDTDIPIYNNKQENTLDKKKVKKTNKPALPPKNINNS